MYADETEKLQNIKQIINSFDLIIDAIFGTGIKGQVTGIAKDIIQFINEASKYVVSIDIPSGIDADTGQICGICVKANETITFGLPKVGTVLHPGKDYTGKLSIVDISIPESIINDENIKLNMIDREQIIDLIPERKENSHKGDYGKVFIVAGSIGMTGAAVLASEAAIKSGTGLVTTACPAIINDILEVKMTEVMTYPLMDNGTGTLQEECVEQIIDRMNKSDVMLFGPGLSLNGDILKILDVIISKSDIPLILDADGINALSMNINILNKLKCPMVITPHPGEMSRLTGLTVSELEKKRIETASTFSKKWNIIVVLKGSATVIACPEGDAYINTTGNPGMATAGSGDVLAGIIASLMGQGLNEKNAAVLGVFIHGLAGDKAQKTKGMHGLVASDIINEIPQALDELYRGKTNVKYFR